MCSEPRTIPFDLWKLILNPFQWRDSIMAEQIQALIKNPRIKIQKFTEDKNQTRLNWTLCALSCDLIGWKSPFSVYRLPGNLQLNWTAFDSENEGLGDWIIAMVHWQDSLGCAVRLTVLGTKSEVDEPSSNFWRVCCVDIRATALEKRVKFVSTHPQVK